MASGRFRSRIRAALTSAAILLPALAVSFSVSPSASAAGSRLIPSAGVTSVSASSAATSTGGIQNPELQTPFGSDGAPTTGSTGTGSTGTGASGGSGANRSESSGKSGDGGNSDGSDNGNGIAASNPQLKASFEGLNHFINRFGVNGGNQFSLEPPDQGLCAGSVGGSTKIFETLNDVLAVYNANGSYFAGPTSQNQFYGYPPAINRTTLVRGPEVTDPSCLYDSATQRWFHVALTLEQVPSGPHAGRLTGKNHLDLAVSTSSNPGGTYNVYRVAAQDDGTDGTPNHGCSGIWYDGTANNTCLADYPHIGADANGFYISTNEYSFFGNDFHGAQIYAFSKRALAMGSASVAVTQLDTHGVVGGNSGFTLAPAQAPPGGAQERAAGGTEYFLSSNAADEAHGDGSTTGPRTSNEILVWALSHTSSLNGTQNLTLSHTAMRAGRYTFPPASTQKAGPTPLRDCLNDPACSTFFNGAPDPFAPEPLYALDSNDSRMLQTTFARGNLWGALDTGIGRGASLRAGIEWFIVKPSIDEEGNLAAESTNSGFLSLPQDNLTYPAIGVTSAGRAVMAFTVVGPNHFPSAGYALLNRDEGTGQVHVAKDGLGPADGFSGYAIENFPNPARPRWGDYGAAAVVGNQVWLASEYIGQTCDLNTWLATAFRCGNTRTALANWDTRISLVTP
jgi:hypothetical protein